MIIVENLNIYQENHQYLIIFHSKYLTANLFILLEIQEAEKIFIKIIYAEINLSQVPLKVGKFEITSIKEDDILLRREVGIVFQDFQLLTDRNIYNNLKFVLKATGWKNKIKINNRIKEVLNAVHLDGMEEKCHMNYLVENNKKQLLLEHF